MTSVTTNMVGRRGDLSSPVVLCNESYLENHGGKEKRNKWEEKSHRIIFFNHIRFLHITFASFFLNICCRLI